MSGPVSADALRDDVARACRALHRDGHEHLVFGHVSARDAEGTIWVKAAGPALDEVDAGHVVAMDADGRPRSDGPALHEEMSLHTELYRARGDIGAVVHTHALHSTAVSLFAAGFKTLSQDAVPFSGRLAHFDSADLVTSPEQGRELARCLGAGRAVLLRGHGLVAIGEDVAEATVNAVLLERAARMNVLASSLGDPEPLPARDLQQLEARFERSRRRRVESLWRYLTQARSEV